MNREILFRGKRVDNGEWVYGIPVEVEAEYGIKKFIISHAKWDCDDNSIDFLETDVREVIPSTIGQYTGLTDKNGRRIFEGDIVKDDVDDTGIVHWDDYHCALMISHIENNSMYYFHNNDFNEVEVIGNIHDNPELLGGE